MAASFITISKGLWSRIMSGVNATEKDVMKGAYKYDKEAKSWRRIPNDGSQSSLARYQETTKIREIVSRFDRVEAPQPKRKKKILVGPPNPVRQPEPEKPKRKKKTLVGGPSASATTFWKKVYKRRKELAGRSDDYIQGLRAGIVEDKRVNKTELAGFAAAKNLLHRRNVESEVKTPKSAPALPALDRETKKALRKEVSDRMNRSAQRAERAEQRANRPAPKRRQKVSADTKAEKWRTDFDEFKRGIGLALCNSSYRYEICRFIQNEGTDNQKEFATKRGIKWKKWWVTPKNPKTGQDYRQINSLEGTCKRQGIDLADEKRRYREKYKNK